MKKALIACSIFWLIIGLICIRACKADKKGDCIIAKISVIQNDHPEMLARAAYNQAVNECLFTSEQNQK